jgi:uncharacterized protein (TIGR00369 family)
MTRTRTYHWEDPAGLRRPQLSGLEVMRALLNGEIAPPPLAQTLGFTLAEVDPGRVVFSMKPAEYMYNTLGSVHGGVFASIMDTAAGAAVHTMLPRGTRFTSLDLAVKFLGAITVSTGEVRCTGTVTHLGKRTALAEARMTDENDRLLATATSSCLLLPVSGPDNGG